MNRCEIINKSNIKCYDDNIKENHICDSCKKINIENIDMNKLICTTSDIYRIIDCKKINFSDFGMNIIIPFKLDNSNYIYNLKGKITIETIEVNYDFIGLEELNLTNSEIFVDGNIYYITPENKINISKTENPIYIFNSAIANIYLKDSCCCDSISDEFICVRVVETDKFFEVNNLSIKITGCIDEAPFSATADLTNYENMNTTSIGLDSLGILSAFTFDTKLCLMKSENETYIKEELKSNLNAYCAKVIGICNEALSPDTFLVSMDFYLDILRTIYSLKKERVNLYSYKDYNIQKGGVLSE